ncbi:MAG: sll0787 family AIR synthase-like protein [Cyanobacteria bacterium P01_H01_bin.21]
MTESLSTLIKSLQQSVSILHKQDIQTAANAIGQYVHTANGDPIRLGDDCAAIPDGDGYLLLAAEGLWPQLVTQDPWFAGWCAIMVNISDIASMGGTPIAVVDTLWSQSVTASTPLWQGMQAAAQAYNVPIVGGHTNCHSTYDGLAVAILGRAQRLMTSFEAQPGDDLVMVVTMAGDYYKGYPFWNGATTAEPALLRQQMALLPQLANAGLCNAGKDISMGGLVGTLLMLAEASGVGASLNLDLVPHPPNVNWDKWLTSFPSFGFLFSVSPEHLTQIKRLFQPHGLTCKAIGKVTTGSQIWLRQAGEQALFWDVVHPLTGFGEPGYLGK